MKASLITVILGYWVHHNQIEGHQFANYTGIPTAPPPKYSYFRVALNLIMKGSLNNTKHREPQVTDKNKTTLLFDFAGNYKIFFITSTRPVDGPAKIAKPTVFQVVLRGIGKSFQSAITTPRMNLTGYGNATAQSWLDFHWIRVFFEWLILSHVGCIGL